MTKKFMALALAVLSICLVFTGCVHADIGVKMNKDKTGSITSKIGIEEDFYEELKESGSDPFEGKTTETYVFNDTTYVSYSETNEYKNYKDMEKALLNMTYRTDILAKKVTDPDDIAEFDNHLFSNVEIKKNGGVFYNSYMFKATMNPQPEYMEGTPNSDIYQFTMTLEMPEKITKSQNGKVEGNKIVFDVADNTKDNELVAFCESNNTGLIIGIIVGFVLIIAAFFIITKKKQN